MLSVWGKRYYKFDCTCFVNLLHTWNYEKQQFSQSKFIQQTQLFPSHYTKYTKFTIYIKVYLSQLSSWSFRWSCLSDSLWHLACILSVVSLLCLGPLPPEAAPATPPPWWTSTTNLWWGNWHVHVSDKLSLGISLWWSLKWKYCYSLVGISKGKYITDIHKPPFLRGSSQIEFGIEVWQMKMQLKSCKL